MWELTYGLNPLDPTDAGLRPNATHPAIAGKFANPHGEIKSVGEVSLARAGHSHRIARAMAPAPAPNWIYLTCE